MKRQAMYTMCRSLKNGRDFEADFAPLPVLNRAFGGSQTSDQLDVMDAIVFPLKPKVLVGPGRPYVTAFGRHSTQ